MCRLIGYTLFWIAAGMIIELLLDHLLISIILILCMLLIGYNLFFCS